MHTFDDLYLLMESYRNTVELNTTLLERQEKINSDQQQILQNLLSVCESQNKILDGLHNIPTEMRVAIEVLCSSTAKKCDGITDDISDLEKTANNIHIEAERNWGGIRNRLYVAYVGMLSIIILLLNIAFQKGPPQ